jgi:protein-S-isoprenylcysteine O-methyltransferase
MLSGLVIRLLSFYTAKSNFTHLVQHEKAEKHQLVTHGIYSLMRHPGYMGFFYYSLASMVFIGNPFCFVAYAVVLSRFFRNRIL